MGVWPCMIRTPSHFSVHYKRVADMVMGALIVLTGRRLNSGIASYSRSIGPQLGAERNDTKWAGM